MHPINSTYSLAPKGWGEASRGPLPRRCRKFNHISEQGIWFVVLSEKTRLSRLTWTASLARCTAVLADVVQCTVVTAPAGHVAAAPGGGQRARGDVRRAAARRRVARRAHQGGPHAAAPGRARRPCARAAPAAASRRQCRLQVRRAPLHRLVAQHSFAKTEHLILNSDTRGGGPRHLVFASSPIYMY